MYRFSEFRQLDLGARPHYMVIGHPIGHSLSPLMHNLALKRHGMEAEYHAIDLDPGETGSMTSWMQTPSFLGANVTIPYKQEFMPIVDSLDETAQSVGALNTVVRRDHELIGYNTDVDGFRQPLEPMRDRLEGGRAIVFGSGGASRAVLCALEQLGMEETVIVSRHPGKLDDENIIPCHYHNWQAYGEESILFVNTTPLGMYPRTGVSPVEQTDLGLLAGKICYDLVYNPLKTKFLEFAASAGAETVDGLEMFIGQGDRAFELWTGHRFPREEVRRRLLSELEG